MEKLSNIEKKAAFSLASIFGLRMMGLFMIMPVFATYSTYLEGVTPLWIGIAIGAYGLTQAVFQIPMGMLSDRFGRKPIIVAGLMLFALGSWIAAQAQTIEMVILGRAMQGMGAIASAILALAADLSRDEQRVKVMAIIGSCIGLSFALSMILGPLLAEKIGLPGLFKVTSVGALLGIALILYAVPHPYVKAPIGDTTAAVSYLLPLLRHPQLLRLNVGIFMLHLLLTALFVVLPWLLIEAGFSRESHWQLYLPTFLLSFVLMVPLMMYAMKRQAMLTVFRGSIVLLAAALVVMLMAWQQRWGLFGATILFFVGFNFLEAALPSMVTQSCPVGTKGTAMGIYSSCQFLGAFCGGLLGGAVYQYAGAPMLLQILLLLLTAWLLLSWSMQAPKRFKNYTLTSTALGVQSAQHMVDKLTQLTGVAEVVVVPAEKTAYLKVDERFNVSEARAVIG